MHTFRDLKKHNTTLSHHSTPPTPTIDYNPTHPTPISVLSHFHMQYNSLTQTPLAQLPPNLCVCVCMLDRAITRLCYNTSLWILQLKALNTTTQRARHLSKVMQTQVSSQYLLTLESQYSTPIPQHNPTTCTLSITIHTIVTGKIPQVESTHNTTLRVKLHIHTHLSMHTFRDLKKHNTTLSHHSTPPTPTIDYNLLTHKRTHSLTHSLTHRFMHYQPSLPTWHK